MKPTRKEKASFAAYIRSNKQAPKDWDNDIGSFAFTSTMIRKYFCSIVENEDNTNRIQLIRQFYDISSEKSQDELLEYIKDTGFNKTKTIENFFRTQTTPDMNTLNLIATLFCPIKNHHDFQGAGKSEKSFIPITWLNVLGVQNRLRRHEWVLSVVVVLLIVTLGSLVFYIPSHITQNELLQQKSALIDQLAFHPTVVPSDSIVLGSAESGKSGISQNKEAILEFFTNNIYNTYYLLPKRAWNFPIDSLGEDINSKYGAPYNTALYNTLLQASKGTSIANKNMKIRFNISNPSDEDWVIDNLYLEITDVYELSDHESKKAIWSSKSLEKSYTVELIGQKRVYPLEVFENIPKGNAVFFALDIRTEDSHLEGKIIRFKIKLSANNGKGSKTNITSDKSYLLGYVKS